MRYFILLIIIISFAQCRTDDIDQLNMTKEIFNDYVKMNIHNYELLFKSIDDAGNRPKDLEILSKADTLRKIREQAGLIFSNQVELSMHINETVFTRYKNLLFENANKFQVIGEVKDIVERTENLRSKNNIKKEKIRTLNIFINTFMAENLILERMAMQIGPNHYFYTVDFFIDTNADTISKNSSFKMLASLRGPFDLNHWRLTSDSVTLTRNDIILDEKYKFEQIGRTIAFEYVPNIPGKYIIKWKSSLDYINPTYHQERPFEKEFWVK